MAGKKPDVDVMVAVPYKDREGNEKTQWHNVGCGWLGANGSINFNVVTMPNVRFVILRKQEGDGAD